MTKPTPIAYHIHLAPDLIGFTFSGTLVLDLEAVRPVVVVSLNALDIAVDDCYQQKGEAWEPCEFLLDPKNELLTLKPEAPLTGNNSFRIHYRGEINNKMAGFYRSGYIRNGQPAHIAVTQFEESDARRAFPCFDHPQQKAVFHISMDIPADLTALSNTPVLSETAIEGGKKRVVFQPTPKMSTYLVFFGVGEFEFVTHKADPRVRVAVLPGKKPFTGFGLDAGRQALAYSEAYFGIPYPLAKMDLIAVPDFAFGAMENWGAITFRENLLLHYPHITSKSGEERIHEVIAHEIAHQWFGNLVTPSDWKYLWLNESFATYFGFGAVHDAHPDWHIWDQFLTSQTAVAMSRDGLHETIPIEIKGGEHVVINTSTAPIIYNKGGSILRQIQGYIGDGDFQKGLRNYLSAYAYQCAESGHLWDAFEKVSHRPVSAMIESWVGQPGFPVVTVKRQGDRLIFTQKRFTYLENAFKQTWKIPIRAVCFSSEGGKKELDLFMETEEATLEIPAGTTAYKLNAGQTGFYRTCYSNKENLDALGALVRQQRLCAQDRWGVQDDLYALVQSGFYGIGDYVTFLSGFEAEGAHLPLSGITVNLAGAYLVMKPDNRRMIAGFAVPWFERVLSNIGYDPKESEPHSIGVLRDQILWQAIVMGSQKAAEFAKGHFSRLLAGDAVHQDILKSVLQAGAFFGGDEEFRWLCDHFTETDSEHERMNVLAAISSFKSETEILSALAFTLDEVPPRNQFMPISAMAANPYAAPFLWGWYRENLGRIEGFHPLHYERVVASIIPAAGLYQPHEVRDFFTSYMSEKPVAADAIRLSLEKLDIYLRMRERG